MFAIPCVVRALHIIRQPFGNYSRIKKGTARKPPTVSALSTLKTGYSPPPSPITNQGAQSLAPEGASKKINPNLVPLGDGFGFVLYLIICTHRFGWKVWHYMGGTFRVGWNLFCYSGRGGRFSSLIYPNRGLHVFGERANIAPAVFFGDLALRLLDQRRLLHRARAGQRHHLRRSEHALHTDRGA